jgi:hypothetical protein
MTDALRGWYRFVKTRRCSACGAWPPVEAAHVRVLLSDKTGVRLPRSHKGRAAWGCIPLCKECHLRQHEMGEEAFREENEMDYAAIVATNLVAHLVEGVTE